LDCEIQSPPTPPPSTDDEQIKTNVAALRKSHNGAFEHSHNEVLITSHPKFVFCPVIAAIE